MSYPLSILSLLLPSLDKPGREYVFCLFYVVIEFVLPSIDSKLKVVLFMFDVTLKDITFLLNNSFNQLTFS